MEEQRAGHQKESSLRHELEQCVVAINICLKEVVQNMDVVLLLRNAYPTCRSALANECVDAGLITKEQGKEFITLIGR